MIFRNQFLLLLIYFIVVSCHSKTTNPSIYLKIFATTPGQFGVENYLFKNDTIFVNDNGYLSGESQLLYTQLSSEQTLELNRLFNELLINGSEIDSSLFHPQYQLECYAVNQSTTTKAVVFSDSISEKTTQLLNFLESLRKQDLLELKASHKAVRDVNLTKLTNSNDTITLSSVESFLIWFDLMSSSPIIVKDIPKSDNLYQIEVIYPIDSKDVKSNFYLNNENIYVVLKKDSVLKYTLRH